MSKINKQTRKKHSAKVKFQVVLETLREQQNITEIARTYGIHANMITRWRNQFMEQGYNIFESDKDRGAGEDHRQADGGDIPFKKIFRSLSFGLNRKIELADKFKHEFSVSLCCAVLDLPRSTYYASRKKISLADKYSYLKTDLEQVIRDNTAYGYRRIKDALKNETDTISTINRSKNCCMNGIWP